MLTGHIRQADYSPEIGRCIDLLDAFETRARPRGVAHPIIRVLGPTPLLFPGLSAATRKDHMTNAYDSSTISATAVVEALHEHGITHAVWLPDSETNFMHVLLTEDDSISLVPVCREGETMAIAAGLWVGGKNPVVMIQNTGVFESGDSIRGMSLDTSMPLVLMVGYRGWTRHGATPDSAARFIEPILDAYGIRYYLVEQGEDMERISMAFTEAEKTKRPVALLMGREFGE